MKTQAKCVLFVIILLLAGSGFAGERTRSAEESAAVDRTAARPALPEGAMATAVPKQREAAPLLYVLPSLGTKEHAAMEIHILQGKRLLIREVVSLPAGTAGGAVVDVLFTHPSEIQRLRTIEAQTPGSLRFLSFIEGRVITDEPFAAIEAQGAKASLQEAVGEVSEVEVKATPRLRVRANDFYEDDPCWQHCNVQYASCLDWCDPRGDSCTQCEIWYHDCYIECPSPPCSDPVSVSTYTNYSAVTAYWYGQQSCVAGQRWDYITVHYLVTVYQRTEHCDGSHTDVFSYSYYQDVACWTNTHISCYPTTSYFVYPQC